MPEVKEITRSLPHGDAVCHVLHPSPALAAKSQQFAAVETGSPGPGKAGPSPVGASGACGWGPARGGGGGSSEHSPLSLGTGLAGGRTDAETQARRPGGGPALECSALGPERLCTRVENSLGWGFVPPPPPHPWAPFQACSGSSHNCAGKFKERRGAFAVGRDNGRK